MNRESINLRDLTRRQLFGRCAMGLGSIALASLLNESARGDEKRDMAHPLSPRTGHFPAKAKNVIYLFMAGGPSQLEMYDYKPKLVELNGEQIPESFVKGKRFAFMSSFVGKERPRLLASKRKFSQHGQSGGWVSDVLPHTARIVDDISIVRSAATDVFN